MLKGLFKKSNSKLISGKTAVLLSAITVSELAHAEGLSRVNDIMQKISSALQAAAVVSVTVAVFWAGYKIVFGGQTFREAAPILIGGVVIGAASQIASMLVG